jgi:hypothetical protein
MGDPELRSDETVLVRTQSVYVKSIPFEGILTNKRIILVDRAKNLLPPKEIPLITIKEIESGENAIRDQILTLSVMAKTGETRQMILTFSRQAGGNRIKDRDEWARIIKENTSTSFEQVIRKVIPGMEQPPRRSEPPTQSRIDVVSAPVRPVAPVEQKFTVPKESGGMHPVRKIIESAPPAPIPSAPLAARSQTAPPVPVPPAPPVTRAEPAPAPSNQFCTTCGTKVPPNSAFCNHCGTPLAAPAPAAHQEPASAASALQQAAEAFSRSTARPIDRDIQSVEPLIERSTARIPSDPLRTVPPAMPVPHSFSYDEEPDEGPAPAPKPPIAAAPAGKQAAKGFLTKLLPNKNEVPAQRKAEPATFGSMSFPPPKPPKGPGFLAGNKKTLIYAAIVLIIVAVGGLFAYPMLTAGGQQGQPISTPTTPVTTVPIHIGTVVIPVTTPPVVPATGIYVHVDYLGGFKGSYGMLNAMTTVPGNSGSRVWEVENANGTIQATFEKLDGSAHELLVEIFRDGAVITKGSTTIGHGSVALSVNLTSGEVSAPVTSGGGTATTVPLNQTATPATAANSTATVTPAANSTTVQPTTAATTIVTTVKTTAAVNTTTAAP